MKPKAMAALAGRRYSEDQVLTEEQEATIRKLIDDKRPEQLKMEFTLWSRAAVMVSIELAP